MTDQKLIETTISKDYVKNWGVSEGLREILQNAIDAENKGFEMEIGYTQGKQKLSIVNFEASLKKQDLLLGSTSKSDDEDQIGKWGEGFKVGALALIRSEKPVTIHNTLSNEIWDCLIDKSSEFDCEVLKFKISQNDFSKKRGLYFIVDNVTQKEWEETQNLFLKLLNLPEETIEETPEGEILLHKNLKGKIYCGGIYVTEDSELKYGYNFKPSSLELNRDRNLVNSFNLKWNTSKMWAYLCANKKGKLFDAKTMLVSGSPDVEFMKEFSDYTVTGDLVENFFKEHSDKAYPVTSNEEASSVRRLGYNPVYSSSSYTGMLRSKLGDIEDLERKVELDYSIFQKITPLDDANIQWVFEVLYKIDPKYKFEIKIAKFKLDSTRSLCQDDSLILNSNLLQNKYDILHEAVNLYCISTKNKETQVWKKILKQVIEGIENEN